MIKLPTFTRLRHAQGASIDALWLTFVRVITTLAGLICVKLVSVYFSLEEYAIYAQAILIISTACSFSILGLTDAVNFFFNTQLQQNHTKEQYIGTLFGLQTIFGGICAVAIIFGSHFLIDYFKSPELKATILWIAFQPLLQNYTAMLQVMFISIGRARHIALINFVWAIAKLSIFAIATLYTGSILTILALTFICEFIQVLYFVIDLRCRGVFIKISKFCHKLIRPVLAYAIPMAAFVIINSLMRDTDKWVIGYLASNDDLSIYANCSRILPFDLVISSFFTVLIPIITRFIHTDKDYVFKLLGSYYRLGIIITMTLVGTAICLSHDFLLCLYDEKYLPGLSIFIIYLLVDLVRFANVTIIYSASGNAQSLLRIVVLSFVINLIFSVALFKALGPIGPALATLLTTIFSYLLYFHGGGKIMDKSLYQLLDIKLIISMLLQLIVAGIFCFLLIKFPLKDFAPSLRFITIYPIIAGSLAIINRKKLILYMREINAVKSSQ